MFRGDRICFLTPSLCKEHHPNLVHIQKLIVLIVKGINAYHKLHPGELAEGGQQLEFSAQLAVYVRPIEYLNVFFIFANYCDKIAREWIQICKTYGC